MTWRTIDSAPRDGTEILAACPVVTRHTDGSVTETWERHVIWANDETGEIHDYCDHGWRFDDYTHWQPLPAPPGAEGVSDE